MMCDPPFGLVPRLQPPGPQEPPEFASDASNGENRPEPGIVSKGWRANWMRVPRACAVVPEGEPEISRLASWPGAVGAFQRHGPPNVGTKVASSIAVTSNVVPMTAGSTQLTHDAVLKVRDSELARGREVPASPVGIPRMGGTDGSPKLPTRTSMSYPSLGDGPGPYGAIGVKTYTLSSTSAGLKGVRDPGTMRPPGKLVFATSALRTTTFSSSARLAALTRFEKTMMNGPAGGTGSTCVPAAPPNAPMARIDGGTESGLKTTPARNSALGAGSAPPGATMTGSAPGSGPNARAAVPPNENALSAGIVMTYSWAASKPPLAGSWNGFSEGTNGSTTMTSGASRCRPTMYAGR